MEGDRDFSFGKPGSRSIMPPFAGIAQMVEQLICNQKVVGSIPTVGTIPKPAKV